MTVLENELIEVCMLISKSAKTVTRMLDLHVCIYWNFAKAAFEWAIHTWRPVDFSNFSVTNMQTSINSFSKTVKWILMIFGAKWSWGLACLVSVFCFLLLFSGKRQKLQEKFRTLFSRHLPTAFLNRPLLGKSAMPHDQMTKIWHINTEYRFWIAV